MANYTTNDYKTAVANIRNRMSRNSAMHYCNDLVNGRTQFGVGIKNRRETLQFKTHLTTFSQSNTYERFIILESFCAKGTFLSDSQDKFIADRLSERETRDENDGNLVKIGNKYYMRSVEETLVSNLAGRIKAVLAKFFEMISDDELAEINRILAEDIKAREQKSFSSLKFVTETIKLKALLKAIEERVLQNSSDGTMS